jgi:hypothetical protein
LLLALILRFLLAFVIMAEDIATFTIDQCRGRQKVLRQNITGCCTRMWKVITNKLSRREAMRLLDDARTLLGDSGPINDRLLELLEEAEGEQQQKSFLRYGGYVDTVADEVAAYISGQEGDEASVPGWDPADTEVLDARQRAQDAAKVYQEAANTAEAALKEMEAAKKSVQDLGEEKDLNGDREDDFWSIISSTFDRSVAYRPETPRPLPSLIRPAQQYSAVQLPELLASLPSTRKRQRKKHSNDRREKCPDPCHLPSDTTKQGEEKLPSINC